MFAYEVPRSGISYAPELEWRQAARWAGFKRFRNFIKLSGREQSEIVAHYRTVNQIDAVVALDQVRRERARAQAQAAKQPTATPPRRIGRRR